MEVILETNLQEEKTSNFIKLNNRIPAYKCDTLERVHRMLSLLIV